MTSAQKLRDSFLVDQMATIGKALTVFCTKLDVRIIAELDANGVPRIIAIPVMIRKEKGESRSIEVLDLSGFEPFPIEWSDERGGYVIPAVQL